MVLLECQNWGDTEQRVVSPAPAFVSNTRTSLCKSMYFVVAFFGADVPKLLIWRGWTRYDHESLQIPKKLLFIYLYIYILICLFPSNNQEETCQTAPEVELEKSRMSNTPHRSWVFRRLSRFVLFRYLHDRLNGIYESYVYPQLIRMCIITRWISSICLIYMGAGDDGKLSALFTSQHV